ncbi:hypothetical protein BDZ97DRAFT_1914576 [Flammula alnicola]|nr:hypothetical protein BDZ97DRAFT_1914576 [Flammula alnicola]
MDSPWDEHPGGATFQDVEWSRMESEFTNVGYREGITAGKESASQEGFDIGFATIGVPIGRELGVLRGISSVIVSFLKASVDMSQQEQMIAEAQDISSQLSRIRFSDVMPRDLEAEEHARKHLEAEDVELDVNEEVAAKRDLEGIEDMLANLTASNEKPKKSSRPTIDDLRALKTRLNLLSEQLCLGIDWS